MVLVVFYHFLWFFKESEGPGQKLLKTIGILKETKKNMTFQTNPAGLPNFSGKPCFFFFLILEGFCLFSKVAVFSRGGDGEVPIKMKHFTIL
jgi:hypothetical protein